MNEYVVAYTGSRGSGKSLRMTYDLFRRYLLKGIPVYSNMPIAVKVNGRVYRSIDLDATDLMGLSAKLRYSVIAIDEIGRWMNARRSMCDNNLIFDYILQQIRKLSLSIYYTVQNIYFVDSRLRFQTDIEYTCQDWHFKNKSVPKGEVILSDLRDWSGKVTGKQFLDTHKAFSHLKLRAKAVWGWYDTYKTQDVMDTNPFQKAKVKGVDEWEPFIAEAIEDCLNSGDNRVVSKDFWSMVEQKAGKELGGTKGILAQRYLSNIKRTRSSTGEYIYKFDDTLAGVA